jgi:hypothetical protein
VEFHEFRVNVPDGINLREDFTFDPILESIFTQNEAHAWTEQEPVFSRRIVTPLENRREGTTPGIWNIFKAAQFEPEDANLPLYRLYPLTRLANGGELALATEPDVIALRVVSCAALARS